MNTSMKTFTFLVFINLVSSLSYSKNVEIDQIQKISKILEPRNFFEIYSSGKIIVVKGNSNCERDILLHLNRTYEEPSAKFNSIWALKMLDASTKIPSGILAGNIVDLGMFDECISVSEFIKETEIRGRHCMYSFEIQKIPTSITFSICLPSSCDAQDVKYIFEKVKNNSIEENGVENWKIDAFDATCSSVDREISVGTIITMLAIIHFYGKNLSTKLVILCTILLFLVICTFLQYFQTKWNFSFKYAEILGKFSLYSSSRRIFNTEINPTSFPALHGIRTLSIFWIVLGHSFTSRIYNPFVNSFEKYKWFQSWESLYVFLAPFAVDTFFMISGFLMTYLFLKDMANGKKFNIFLYYFHRYIRLTPVVGMLLLITIFILPHLGSGPIWEKSLKNILSGTCEQKWWTVLLYVQNYIRTDIECLGHTWYLAADMHFYWISPIILIPLMKKPKLGLAILGGLFIASLVIVGTLVGVNGYISTLYSNAVTISVIKDSFRFFYTVSHTRASSWLVGIYLGYIIHSNPAKLGKTSVFFGWLGAIFCFIFCTMGQRICLDESYKYNPTFETTFAMFSRPMWAIGVAWVVFASIYGYGGFVTKILSLPIFLPLSRISFCIYVVHATLQIAKVNTARTADYFSEFQMFNSFLSEIVLTVVVAFFFSIFFESPVMILEKMIFRGNKRGNHQPGNQFREAENGSKISHRKMERCEIRL